MKVVAVGLVILLFCIVYVYGKDGCTLVDDAERKNMRETLCYLSCLSNALNTLYIDGEKKLFVNEEVYANASRILDEMEGRADGSVRYLSVVSGVMGRESEILEKLISYGNEMGDLVAKVGGLFAEVNESVRAVREVLPSTLITANKYYTAIAEIVRTVWDDVISVGTRDEYKCQIRALNGAGEFPVKCGDHTCPLREGVDETGLHKYVTGCIEINVQNGFVSECLNVPRNVLYANGVVYNCSDKMKWSKVTNQFRLIVEIRQIFGPLIAPFSAGQSPSVLHEMMSNITSLYTQFRNIRNNFTSLLQNTNITSNINSTGPAP